MRKARKIVALSSIRRHWSVLFLLARPLLQQYLLLLLLRTLPPLDGCHRRRPKTKSLAGERKCGASVKPIQLAARTREETDHREPNQKEEQSGVWTACVRAK